MRLQKVKRKGDGLVVEYEDSASEGRMTKMTLDCPEKPAPELLKAIATLDQDVIEICEQPKDSSIAVSGVSFSYGGDNQVMGAVIMAKRMLKQSDAILVLNTPHKASESYNDATSAPGALLSDGCQKRLKKVINETVKYIEGKREQTNLFDEKQYA